MRREYSNPPIMEAACQLIFEGSIWDPTIPGQFYDKIKHTYPLKRAIQKMGLEVNLAGPPTTQFRKEGDLMRFVNEKEARIVQLSRDLLIVNQQRPYPASFELWKPAIIEMFEHYRALTAPKRLAGLSLHYLNQIVIPGFQVNLPEYFQVFPRIPQALEDHGNFFLRLEAVPEHLQHKLIITFGSAPSADPGNSPHILDIFDQHEFPDESGFITLAGKLDEAHENIQSAFEHSITDRARALFGKER